MKPGTYWWTERLEEIKFVIYEWRIKSGEGNMILEHQILELEDFPIE